MTRLRRFFAGDGDCLDGDKIVLYGEFAHISRVLRMKAGDRLIVCFNDGRDCECEIESFDKDCVRLKILSVSCCAAENDVGGRTSPQYVSPFHLRQNILLKTEKSILSGVYFYTAGRFLFRRFGAQSPDASRQPLNKGRGLHIVREENHSGSVA